MESTSASSEAVMIFSLTPTVPHSRLPSVLWMSTRVLAPVPATPSRIRLAGFDAPDLGSH